MFKILDKKSLSERDICTKFITPALEKAGWKQISWKYPGGRIGEIMRGGIGMRRPALGSAAASNVMIELHPPETVIMSNAAKTLADELNKLGIEAAVVGFNIPNENTNAIHILIGPHTIGTQLI